MALVDRHRHPGDPVELEQRRRPLQPLQLLRRPPEERRVGSVVADPVEGRDGSSRPLVEGCAADAKCLLNI
ncbi:hypothetical protein ACEN85_17145, partial [Curtobacterium sp. CT11-45]|uniref:hypothetical protein n=1 Tax=Curtobacterium sp. CT11-45 TaxID=3243037 RepID=UPI0039B0C386